MVFDIDLALKQQTDENPIFYVQMAHARLSGIFRTADRDAERSTGDARSRRRCRRPRTPSCSRSSSSFPEVVEKAAREREPHRVTVYLHELATAVPLLVSPHARGRRARGPDDRTGPAAPGPRRAHRARQRPHAARHLRPRPDVI